MYKLSVAFKEQRPPELLQKKMNDIMREVLRQVALYWLSHYREQHFLPGAVQRYQYVARTAKYNAVKRRAMQVKDWQGVTHLAPKPPSPLVWSGSMRDAVLKKSPNDFRILARATAVKQVVTIKVPIPHPLNPKNAGELGRMIPSEIREMHDYGVQILLAELEKVKQGA